MQESDTLPPPSTMIQKKLSLLFLEYPETSTITFKEEAHLMNMYRSHLPQLKEKMVREKGN